jgi:hypothetical protein
MSHSFSVVRLTVDDALMNSLYESSVEHPKGKQENYQYNVCGNDVTSFRIAGHD